MEQENRAEELSLGEADGSLDAWVPQADLRERLERLPVGHPSSPYRNDGSRKPSPPDLTDLELPLPDEPSFPADQGDLKSGEEALWESRGRKLKLDGLRAADRALAQCRDAEGRDVDGTYGDRGLTPAMRRIEAQLEHGHLIEDTEKFALKEPDSFKEKLAKLIERYPGTDPKELAGSIHDGVRYTLIFDFEHYTQGVEIGQARLVSAGYDRIETKPSWAAEEYKGVNTRWREPSVGVMFEVQFHTHESWDAKQKTHEAYKKIHASGTSIEDAERLRDYQRDVSAQVRIPPGALEIQPYKKER